MELLNHFSHNHPLNLIKVDHLSYRSTIICDGCKKPISQGLVYYCKKCQYFLHKRCTELPAEITNPMHPQHKLHLRSNRRCICNVCRRMWTGFTYLCEPCDFDIDINCRLLERTDKYNIIGHDHQAEFHPRSSMFFCDACGEMGEDASYQCFTCHFMIHKNCGKLLDTVQDMCHEHPLSLRTCIPNKYRSKNTIFCQVCGYMVRVNYWSYLCRVCGIFFHLNCLKEGTSRGIPADHRPKISCSEACTRDFSEKEEEFSGDSRRSESDDNLRKHQQQISIDHAVMDELEGELSKMVGLNDLKEQLRSWVIQVMMDFERQKRGMSIHTKLPPHLALLGNPGTGKTTVARLLGKMLHKFGVLPSDKFIEVRRTDLVAQYIGQTGPKTRKKIDEAEGGILFVDEAYELIKENSKHDYGSEVIGELMSAMDKEKLSIIIAGYPAEIQNMFSSSNPGFRRRMSKLFQFDNYSCEELAEILQLKLKTEGSRFYGFQLERKCTLQEIGKLIREMTIENQRNNMNAGLVDQMLNNAKESMDSRVFALKYVDNDSLNTITLEDLKVSLKMLEKNRETGGT